MQKAMSAFPLESDRNSRHRRADRGQSTSALPLQGSNVDLLRNGESIINVNAEISDSTFYLGVAEQKLDSSQIARTAVDERRFSPPQ
jgi:hypothetical protein